MESGKTRKSVMLIITVCFHCLWNRLHFAQCFSNWGIFLGTRLVWTSRGSPLWLPVFPTKKPVHFSKDKIDEQWQGVNNWDEEERQQTRQAHHVLCVFAFSTVLLGFLSLAEKEIRMQKLMRLIPPVFGSFREALQDTSFGGYDIPKGWKVFWTSSPTHMDKDIFADPDEFDPSRFQNPSKPIPPFAYIPFGAGVHMCIGNEFARVETLTIVHNMIMNFEWSQVNPEETITRQPMPYPSMGLPIKIKARITSA